MKIKFIKIDFNSEAVELISDRVNILSWAVGGLNYIGFDLQGVSKIATTVIGWFLLQYLSLVFLKISQTLKKEEAHGVNESTSI